MRLFIELFMVCFQLKSVVFTTSLTCCGVWNWSRKSTSPKNEAENQPSSGSVPRSSYRSKVFTAFQTLFSKRLDKYWAVLNLFQTQRTVGKRGRRRQRRTSWSLEARRKTAPKTCSRRRAANTASPDTPLWSNWPKVSRTTDGRSTQPRAVRPRATPVSDRGT